MSSLCGPIGGNSVPSLSPSITRLDMELKMSFINGKASAFGSAAFDSADRKGNGTKSSNSKWMKWVKARALVETPIILDIEASGFGSGSYPIEIGVAMPDGQLYVWLVKRHEDWTHWQDSAEQIHGISREQLQRDGQPLREVADELNELLAGKTVFSDGWGVDRGWLALLFHDAGVLQGFKLDAIYGLLDEDELEQWGTNREKVLAITGFIPHRAGTDALIIQKTYLYTIDSEIDLLNGPAPV